MSELKSKNLHTTGPHAGQPVLRAGPSLKEAGAALVLVHGRGASAGSILPLFEELGAPPLATFAPEAAGHTWYPQSFLAPLAANQPWLDSALGYLDAVIS